MAWRLAVVLAMASLAFAEGLSLKGVRCGQLTCTLSQYCSQLASRCEECSDICDERGHNYDQGLCTKMCQDYIHDIRYVKRQDGFAEPFEDEAAMKASIQNLQFKISVIIIIISIVLVLLILVVGVKCFLFIKGNYKKFSWAWIRKKIQTPKKSPKTMVEVIENKKVENTTANTSDVPTLSVFTLQTTQTTPRRQPAEDASLDFSYDNMALHLTPTTSAPRQPQI